MSMSEKKGSGMLSQLSSKVSASVYEAQGVEVVDHLLRDEATMELDAHLIYFIALSLLLGLVLREVNKKTKFPYSPMVLGFGIFLGLGQANMGFLGESTAIMGNMHPHIILYVFIPVLLFESAFNSDWFIFKKASINILILAGPGVCWGAFLLGVILKLVLFYGSDDMTWYQALTLGAVLSATDPVAVVSLLKELGASARFNTLIEGEALFNDGTAMVFFLFFCNLSKGAQVGFFSTVGSFMQNALLGPIIGVVLAFAASLWTRRVVGDDVQVTWLTFIFTYLTFYICEFQFHTSGILGVICLGLFWSAFGKTKIRPESAHAVHTVWSFIQYSADTLIFLLVGIIVGTVVLEEEYIYPSDWVRMFFFYIFMTMARYIMILTFMPLLRMHGYPISKSEMIVLVYGGLRGALGLCLSLLVGVDEDLPIRFRHLTVFYMASMAALTNLINGTTCKYLVNYLNMIDEPAVKKKVYKSYLKELIVTSDDKSKELASDKFFTMVDWSNVKQLTGSDKLIQSVIDLDNQLRNNYSGEGRSSFEGIGEAEMYGEVRYRSLRILKGLYYQKFEQGLTEENSCILLVESSNINLDATHSILNIWELLFVSFTSFGAISYWFRIKDTFFIGRYAQQFITQHLGFIYDVTTSFIACANEAMLLIQHLPVNKSAIRVIFEEIQSEIDKAELYLSNLQSNFPEVLRAIQTRRASHSVLVHQRHYLEETHQSGLVDDKEFESLEKDVNTRLVALENHIFDWVVPTFHSIVMKFPLFSMLTNDEIQIILTSQMEKKYFPGEIIYEQGMTCQYIYIITRGNANDHLSDEVYVKKGLGSILSYANAVSSNGRCLSTCRALTETVVNAISFKALQEIMVANLDFEEKIYINSLDYLIKINVDRAGPLISIDERRLAEFLRSKASFKRLDEHSKIQFALGGYIFKGEVQTCLNENNQSQVERYGEFSYVPPKDGEFTVTKGLVAVVFDEDASVLENEQVERFNLEEHENVVDRLFTQTGQHDRRRSNDGESENNNNKHETHYLEIQDQ